MEVREGDVHLRLGPIRRDDARRFVAAEAGFGLQSYEVLRYLGGPAVPTEQTEEEWWDKASKDEGSLGWGVYLPDGDDAWQLVGNTDLRFRSDRRQAESGFVLFDRAHWRQRVASTAHLGRTLFAFRALDLLAITSSVAAPNTGSNRALVGVGYVRTGTRYSLGVADGRVVDSVEYLLPNPEEDAWRFFWRRPDSEIPAEFHQGRDRAIGALDRASRAVTYL
jgi:RimJ/RimL family protein N-acetyltransferase